MPLSLFSACLTGQHKGPFPPNSRLYMETPSWAGQCVPMCACVLCYVCVCMLCVCVYTSWFVLHMTEPHLYVSSGFTDTCVQASTAQLPRCVCVCLVGSLCECVCVQRENVLTAVLWFWACPLEVAINPERSALTVSAVQPMNGY